MDCLFKSEPSGHQQDDARFSKRAWKMLFVGVWREEAPESTN